MVIIRVFPIHIGINRKPASPLVPGASVPYTHRDKPEYATTLDSINGCSLYT